MTQIGDVDAARQSSVKTRLGMLRRHTGWIIAFGILLVVLGGLAFTSVFAATIVTVYFVGISMIAAGFAEIVMGFRARPWGRSLLWIVLGVVYAIAGLFAFTNPLLAASLLTLVLGALLVATGVVRIILAFEMREGKSWIWVVVSGLITLLLGLMILAQWPISSLYILGVFLSIDLLFAGIGWISLGAALSAKKLAN